MFRPYIKRFSLYSGRVGTPGHVRHSAQVVTVFAPSRVLEPGTLYRIVSVDGWQGHAFGEELTDVRD